MFRRGKKTFLFGGLVLSFFILDRLLKNLYFFEPDFGFLKFQENYHFLFIFQGSFFYWLTLLIFIGLVFWLVKSYQQKNNLNVFALSLILIGGFSNFWDRFLYGFVIDYFIFLNLWILNLADLMICIGLLILLTNILRKK